MKTCLITAFVLALPLYAGEVPQTSERHTFQGGLSSTEVYRSGDLVLVSTCMDAMWSAHISTSSKSYQPISFSELLPLGGGGIYRLFFRDYNGDEVTDLMACLYNGGRSGSGANQNQVVFFMITAGKVELRATGWVKDFDPTKYTEYFEMSTAVASASEAAELIQK